MRVVIIEDEIPAANRLASLLGRLPGEIEVVKKLDSVEASVQFLPSAEAIDLIFMDIQLADGLSFSIFDHIDQNTPVIFTTAYDQYAIKAFKVNSLAYLLKPIDQAELAMAVEKYKQWYLGTNKGLSEQVKKLTLDLALARESNTPGPGINSPRYKERLLIKKGRQLHYLKTADAACFFADGKLCFAIDFTGNRYLVEYNLNQLEEVLLPQQFYRINRHLLVNIESVKKIHPWLGGRLKLELSSLPTQAEPVVSRERVNGFKVWLGQ